VKDVVSDIAIGTALYRSEVRERLKAELNFLTGEGLAIEWKEEERDLWTFFVLQVIPGKKYGKKRIACRFAIAKAISDLFVNHVEIIYVKNYIDKYYRYWLPREREEIANRAGETLKKLRVIRRNKILQNLYDYLADQQILLIEGYANFRLKDYWSQLRRMVQRAGQELVAAKDYFEFIRLLRYFVEIQEPKIQKVHVFINSAGTFYLFDQKGNIIRKEVLSSPSLTVNNGEFSYEDFLLSILITLVPQKITFHVPDRIWHCESVQTIQQVFGNRVIHCTGCDKCRHLYANLIPT